MSSVGMKGRQYRWACTVSTRWRQSVRCAWCTPCGGGGGGGGHAMRDEIKPQARVKSTVVEQQHVALDPPPRHIRDCHLCPAVLGQLHYEVQPDLRVDRPCVRPCLTICERATEGEKERKKLPLSDRSLRQTARRCAQSNQQQSPSAAQLPGRSLRRHAQRGILKHRDPANSPRCPR